MSASTSTGRVVEVVAAPSGRVTVASALAGVVGRGVGVVSVEQPAATRVTAAAPALNSRLVARAVDMPAVARAVGGPAVARVIVVSAGVGAVRGWADRRFMARSLGRNRAVRGRAARLGISHLACGFAEIRRDQRPAARIPLCPNPSEHRLPMSSLGRADHASL